MYTLYYLPGACSLAIQVVLRELGQPVQLIHRDACKDFSAINPVGSVPVLKDAELAIREGAAILLHLLAKHQSPLLPIAGAERATAIQHLMFANATMHPAYGRLFFISQTMADGNAKDLALDAAAADIDRLWRVVEAQLADQPFLGGHHHGPADVLLTVYSRWGDHFPVSIAIGERSRQMIERIAGLPAFQQSLEAEAIATDTETA